MPKGVRIPLHELNMMLSFYKRNVGSKPRMQIYEELAEQFENKYHVESICGAVQRMMPTTDLAQAVLQRGAVRLASRVLRKANVVEAIDILSRPNIGVLDPIKKQEGGGGFLISMSADSCGAVKVGVAFGQAAEQAKLSDGGSDSTVMITESDIIDVPVAPKPLPQMVQPGQGVYEKALARSKARLEAARNKDGLVRTRRQGHKPPVYKGHLTPVSAEEQ